MSKQQLGHVFPIHDPTTGEILATNEQERRDVADGLAAQLATIAAAADEAADLRAKLLALLGPGEPVALGGGWAVMRTPAPRPKRQVVQHALATHSEALPPELRPVTETKEVTTYPTVAQLTSKAALAALARAGLKLDTFVHTPSAEAQDTITVVRPPREDEG